MPILSYLYVPTNYGEVHHTVVRPCGSVSLSCGNNTAVGHRAVAGHYRCWDTELWENTAVWHRDVKLYSYVAQSCVA